MTNIAIQVDNISKQYQIGVQRQDTLRDALANLLPRMTRIGKSNNSKNSSSSRPESNTIWALKDVSFEVERGEVVGVIGRNGAGKRIRCKLVQ
ncbi:MAG: ATP-binding cassette domain-containing protein [Anaerolineales bacterium]|nr:ATP-binding cassette domain-containing protein [Anaerolineales bacterium]